MRKSSESERRGLPPKKFLRLSDKESPVKLLETSLNVIQVAVNMHEKQN